MLTLTSRQSLYSYPNTDASACAVVLAVSTLDELWNEMVHRAYIVAIAPGADRTLQRSWHPARMVSDCGLERGHGQAQHARKGIQIISIM